MVRPQGLPHPYNSGLKMCAQTPEYSDGSHSFHPEPVAAVPFYIGTFQICRGVKKKETVKTLW